MLCDILGMSQKGTGRVIAQGRAKTRFISVPSDVASDSTFPFEDGEEVTVRIEEDKNRVVVERVE